ncbi:FxLD family lanthipeptide [Spongiactinospora sp. TRM90649]|uniref:FxLD family lanthipeptide n=1 Tax=Spongiactinospora sp. TRM90649 TaxID=3031114 RepID=UPI0023F775F5|nr:FxLD family lanthipeptide [Spongiactinospora sp. TRM90649]MDF5758817.1 FxLD family lanthipeptide [Spongiactinospora sp. TRM90649]
MDTASPPQPISPPGLFDLDISLLEVSDPAGLVNMTDDNCGSTCEKSTCVTGA